MGLKLDLGSGRIIRDGYEGVDIHQYPGVKYWGINLDPGKPGAIMAKRTGWRRFDDSSVEAVVCSHLVEHIHDLVGFMRELWRVCEDGAIVEISHPYQFNVRAWQDPTHVRAINEVSWFYYDKEWRGDYGEDASAFGDTDFELVDLDAIPESNWQGVADERPEEFERAARNQINVISDLRVTLRCRKP